MMHDFTTAVCSKKRNGRIPEGYDSFLFYYYLVNVFDRLEVIIEGLTSLREKSALFLLAWV